MKAVQSNTVKVAHTARHHERKSKVNQSAINLKLNHYTFLSCLQIFNCITSNDYTCSRINFLYTFRTYSFRGIMR